MSSLAHNPALVRLGLCALLCVQNSAITLLMRYSKGVLKESYINNISVIGVELTKLIACALIVLNEQHYDISKFVSRIKFVLACSLPLSVPGLIYLVQNNLSLYALARLDSSTFSILAQSKLIFTAILSVLMLGKSLYTFQWRALLLLTIGVILVQSVPSKSETNSSGSGSRDTASLGVDKVSGCLATLGLGVLSALAGVYFEKMLKGGASVSVWERNIQLSFYSIIFGVITTIFNEKDWIKIQENGPLTGFSIVTWAIIFVNALGGILVSLVVKHADNIVKNFAITVALLLSTIVSYFVFNDVNFTTQWFCGALVVIVSVFNYSEDVVALTKSLQSAESASSNPLPQSNTSAILMSEKQSMINNMPVTRVVHRENTEAGHQVEIEVTPNKFDELHEASDNDITTALLNRTR